MSKFLFHDEAFLRCLGSANSFIWFRALGPLLLPSPHDIKKMADVQIAFFRQLCRLQRSVTPAIIFRELS